MKDLDGYEMNGQQNQSDGIGHDGNEIDAQVELALKHFRESVHAWSDAEFGHVRQVQLVRRNNFLLRRFPALSWAAAAVLAIAAVSVPVSHEYREQQLKRDAFAVEQKKIADEAAERQRAYAIDDEQLLRNVDSDIAQQAPDAMQPLASLMTDSYSPKK